MKKYYGDSTLFKEPETRSENEDKEDIKSILSSFVRSIQCETRYADKNAKSTIIGHARKQR